MLYSSANRDPATFGSTAGEFHIDRDPNHHVAFGFGAHFCLGATLARLEIALEVLDELLDGRPRARRRRRPLRLDRHRRHLARARRVLGDDESQPIAPPASAYRGDAVQLDLPVLDAGAGHDDFRARRDRSRGRSLWRRRRRAVAGRVAAGTPCRRVRQPATAVYFPPGARSRDARRAPRARTGDSRRPSAGELSTRRPGLAPAVIEPGSVVAATGTRAGHGWRRDVHDVIARAVPAQRLLVGENFNAAGRVVVVPAAQTRRRRRRAHARRGVLLPLRSPRRFRVPGPVRARPATEAGRCSSGTAAVVGIPHGYHPVCAAPGYRALLPLGAGRRDDARARACSKIPHTAGCTTSPTTEQSVAGRGCPPHKCGGASPQSKLPATSNAYLIVVVATLTLTFPAGFVAHVPATGNV